MHGLSLHGVDFQAVFQHRVAFGIAQGFATQAFQMGAQGQVFAFYMVGAVLIHLMYLLWNQRGVYIQPVGTDLFGLEA